MFINIYMKKIFKILLGIFWKFVGLVTGQSYEYFVIHSKIYILTLKEFFIRIKYCFLIYKLKNKIGIKKGFKNKFKFLIYLFYVKIYLFLRNNLFSEFAIVPNSMIYFKALRHFSQSFGEDIPDIITEVPDRYFTNPYMIDIAKRFGFYNDDIEKYEYYITDIAYPVFYNEYMKNTVYNTTFTSQTLQDINFFYKQYIEIETRNVNFEILLNTIKDSFNNNFIFYNDSEFYIHYFFLNNIFFKPEYKSEILQIYERSLKTLFDLSLKTKDSEILGEDKKNLREEVSEQLERTYEFFRDKKQKYAYRLTKIKSFFIPMSEDNFYASMDHTLVRLGFYFDNNTGQSKEASVGMMGEGFLYLGQPYFLSGYFEIDDLYFNNFWDDSTYEELKLSLSKRYLMRYHLNEEFTILQTVISRIDYLRVLTKKFYGEKKIYSTLVNLDKVHEYYTNYFKFEDFSIIKKSSVDYPRNYFGLFHFVFRNFFMFIFVFLFWKYGTTFLRENRFKFYDLFEDRWDHPNTVHLFTFEEFFYTPLVLKDMLAEAYFLFLCFCLFHVLLFLLLSKTFRKIFYIEFYNFCLFIIHMVIRVGFELGVGYRIYGFDVWWYIKLPMDHPLYIFLVDDDENDLTGTSFSHEGLSAREYNFEEDDIMPREHMFLIIKIVAFYERFLEKLSDFRLYLKRKYYYVIEPSIFDSYFGFRIVEDQIIDDFIFVLTNKTICGYIVFYSVFLIVFYSAQLLWWLYRRIKLILSSS